MSAVLFLLSRPLTLLSLCHRHSKTKLLECRTSLALKQRRKKEEKNPQNPTLYSITPDDRRESGCANGSGNRAQRRCSSMLGTSQKSLILLMSSTFSATLLPLQRHCTRCTINDTRRCVHRDGTTLAMQAEMYSRVL